MNPRDIQKLMKQMNVEEIDADQVIIISGEREIVFDQPKVSKMTMMGQETYQIMGTPYERDAEELAEEGGEAGEGDLDMIMEKTGADLEAAKGALEGANGDLAQAIIDLGK